MDPAEYLRSTYYEHWLFGMEALLVEKGLVTAEEMAELKARQPAPAGLAAVPPDRMAEVIRRGGSAKRGAGPARFEVGQRVVARNIHPTGPTPIPPHVPSRTGTQQRSE